LFRTCETHYIFFSKIEPSLRLMSALFNALYYFLKMRKWSLPVRNILYSSRVYVLCGALAFVVSVVTSM